MKKKLSIFLIVVLAIVSILSTVNYSDASDKFNFDAAYLNDPIRAENESLANVQYTLLIDEMHAQSGKNAFPDYYGGAYIDNEGHLIVCLTDNYFNDDIKEIIRKYTKNEQIKIIPLSYSFNKLLNILDILTEILSNCNGDEICRYDRETIDYFKSVSSI